MGFENREYYRDNNGFPSVRLAFPPLSPLFIVIASVNLAVFLIQAGTGGTAIQSPLIQKGAFTLFDGLWYTQPWRWFTYQYLHADGRHIFFNMLSLYFFLSPVERAWGWKKTYGFYTLCGFVAAIGYAFLSVIFPNLGPLVGASGSVLGILGAAALLFPNIVYFFCIPIRLFACLLGILYLLSVIGDRDYGDAAHLFGLVFGFFGPYLALPRIRAARAAIETRTERNLAKAEIDEQAEIDRILAKVSAQGMHSLTRGEQKTLKHATERQQKRNTAQR